MRKIKKAHIQIQRGTGEKGKETTLDKTISQPRSTYETIRAMCTRSTFDTTEDNDNDNDNDTLRKVPHLSNEGLALQARV